MKKLIFTMLFSLALVCYGLCFGHDVKQDTDIQKIEVSHAFTVDVEAPAILTVDPVPLIHVSHETANELQPAVILDETVSIYSAVEHRQQYWRNRSWGKAQKGFRLILKFPSKTSAQTVNGLQNRNPIFLC